MQRNLEESKREKLKPCSSHDGISRLFASCSPILWIASILFAGMLLLGLVDLLGGGDAISWWLRPATLSSGAFMALVSSWLGLRTQYNLGRRLSEEASRHKQAEEELHDSARLNRLLLDSLPYPAMLARRDRVVLAANRVAHEAGIRVGSYCWRDLSPGGDAREAPEAAPVEQGGNVPFVHERCAFCQADRALDEGRSVNITEVSAFGRKWNMWWIPTEGDVFFHYATDITDQKVAEEALRKSEDRLRHLSSQLLTTQERERKQIAQELHDSVGQSLSAIKFAIENSLRNIHTYPSATELSDALIPLHALVPVVQQAIDEIRRIYMELRPTILDDLGILSTINWFCRQYRTIYSNVQVDQYIDVEEEDVPEQTKIVIFRVMQEAFHNVSKHSQADMIRISLAKRDSTVELMITDNGTGFDLEKLLAMDSYKKGLGLASMKERTELSGGSFSIQSAIGEGTTLRFIWPVAESFSIESWS